MKRAINIALIMALVVLVSVVGVGCKGQDSKSTSVASDNSERQTAGGDTNKIKNSEKAPSAKTMTETKTTTTTTTTTIKITLYFSDDQARYLVPETREVAVSQDIAKVAMEELAKGPKEQGHYQTIPSTTKVNKVTVNDSDIAFVDFSKEFVSGNPGGSTGEIMAVYSVVDTLTELPGTSIKSVKFLVDGKQIDTITGHLDLSDPVTRYENIIKK